MNFAKENEIHVRYHIIWKCLDRFGLLLGLILIAGGILGHGIDLSPGGTVALGGLLIMVAAED